MTTKSFDVIDADRKREKAAQVRGLASKIKMMIRSFTYRLYPTRTQIASLERHLDLTRELYNAALQERRDAWRSQKKRITAFDQFKDLPAIRTTRPEFESIAIDAQRGALRRLERAYQSFFRRCKNGESKKKLGYPRFKGKNRFNSISYDDVKKNPIVAGGKRISIPLLGKIKIDLHRPQLGKPKQMAIKREQNGHWYAILACENVPPRVLSPTGKMIGIDLGISKLVVTSNGKVYENPRVAERARLRLERSQRRITRRKRGSNRRRKAVLLLNRASYHVTQIRRQYAIDVANDLVRNNDVICIEDLNIKGLCRSRLAKQVHDVSWSTLVHWIHVKAESAGREIVVVDPRNTSQMCSGCGQIVKKDLSVRVHTCSCGLTLDRDENAARNILALGLSVRGAAAAVGARR